MTAPRETRIGELNGRWALLIKVMLATYPIVVSGQLAWATWVTSNVFHLQPDKPRYTFADAERQHAQMWRAFDARMDALPPDDWRDRILSTERQLRTIEANQIKILSKLEQR